MNKYVYTDNTKHDSKIVFCCEAKDILEADKAYKEKTGKDVMKQPHVGCQIIKLT